MQISAEKLDQALSGQLAPIFLISSEDTFLQQEASDKVRNAARLAGFEQREKHVVDTSFDWSTLTYAAQSLSLFGDKKLLELHIGNGKPGDKGGKALREYTQILPMDTILLLVMGKIDKASTNSKWYKTLAEHGTVCRLWPIDARQMPHWIEQRLKQKNLTCDAEALQLLAEKVEGNLLAAAQEVDKLSLSVNDGKITSETVINMIGNSARYNVFELVEACLQGQTPQVVRIMNGLRAEGSSVLAVLAIIGSEIRKLLDVKLMQESGTPINRAMEQKRIWKNRQAATQAALQRNSTQQFFDYVQQCQRIDIAAKGGPGAQPWDALLTLCLQFCGQRQLNALSAYGH